MIIHADIVCSYPTGSLASSAFSENFSAFEHSIMRFTTTLLPLHQVGGAIPDDKYALIVIHSLAHASMIRLHAPFMHDDGAVNLVRDAVLVAGGVTRVDVWLAATPAFFRDRC